MHWLNIEITRTQGPEYTSAEPAQQLAWFHLLLYCAQQENGGIIHGASTFSDRQWQRLIDVDGSTIRSGCALWSFTEDGDLIVWQYPAKQEQVVQAKRDGGRKGGETKAQNRRTPSSTPCRTPTSTPSGSPSRTPSRTPSTKEEVEVEMEEKKEEEQKEEVSAPDSESAIPAPGPEGVLFDLPKESVQTSKPKRTKRTRETPDIPESEDAVFQYGQTLTPPLPLIECRKFFSYWSGEQWCRRNGPVRSWKQSLVTWQLNWIERNPKVELPKASPDDPRYVEITQEIGKAYEEIVEMPFVSSENFNQSLLVFLSNWHGDADLFLSVYRKALSFRDREYSPKEIRLASDPVYLCDNFQRVVAAVDWVQAGIDRESKPKTFTKGI